MNVNFNIPMDKQAHFWWGMAMSGVFYHAIDMWVVLVVIVVGFLKEIMDDRDGRLFDHYDWLATCVGGLLGAAASWVLS